MPAISRPTLRENPLLHLWSLGIEEQFYIFWPPALLLMANSERRRRWIAGLTLVSFGISLLIFFGYREWSFYSPLPRAWELLAGGILADRLRAHPEGLKTGFARYPDLRALAGVVLIAGATFGLSSDSLFPGLEALLPTLGAMMIIVSPLSWINRIVLSSPPMVLLGLISYPLYLWHWPLLVYLSILRNGVPNFLEIWLAVIVAVMLSWLTFRFVETPLRRAKDVVPKLAFGLVAVGVVGIATAAGSGFDFRFAPEIRAIAKLAPQNNSGLRDLCFMETPGAKFSSDCIEQGDKRLLFLWGDSTAATLYPGLKKAEEKFPFRLARFAAPGCAPILANRSRPACDANNDLAFGFLKSSHPDIVLLHGDVGPNPRSRPSRRHDPEAESAQCAAHRHSGTGAGLETHAAAFAGELLPVSACDRRQDRNRYVRTAGRPTDGGHREGLRRRIHFRPAGALQHGRLLDARRPHRG